MYTSNLLSLLLLHTLFFFLPMRRCSTIVGCLKGGESGITDDIRNSTTLVSPENIFELGFFTPDGSTNNNRYLGIWYRNYTGIKIVVWVANRNNPLLEYDSSFTIEDGNAKLLDKHGSTCWSSDSDDVYDDSNPTSPDDSNPTSPDDSNPTSPDDSNPTSPNSLIRICCFSLTTLCLHDTGNLILTPGNSSKLWQSFDHPTDTFLPGMVADENVKLISWQNPSMPASGNFTLLLQQTILNIVLKTGSTYWENAGAPVNEIPTKLTELLQNRTTNDLTRLVIDFTGQVQLWECNISEGWSLTWFEPKHRCSRYNVCGNFGSCNSYSLLSCKCLPGFTPIDPPNWNARQYSGGCSAKSRSCGRESSDDMFLPLPMMKVGLLHSETSHAALDCKLKCLEDCNCVAYSSDHANQTGTRKGINCTTWTSTELTGLQEDYPGGITLHVRTTNSDIAQTSRGCGTCGTYTIPYPLSTATNCGDPSYFYFHCNTSTGQVAFSTSNGTFNVTLVIPENNTFFIQVAPANSCDSKTLKSIGLSNMHLIPFNVRNCTYVSYQPSIKISQPFIEVEIGWQSPPEPTCNVSSDCRDWPLTTCKAVKGGKMRCMCTSNLEWDGMNLKCQREGEVMGNKIVMLWVACIAAALLLVACTIVFIYWKRRIARETGAVELMGDNIERIDLPVFDWESILLATDNFADKNKLGTGGFGSVYKGNFPDGEKIAVKRLSSVSVQGVEEFRTEVLLIAKLQHRNLVRLLGYCVKADEKILVYEYMPNGSLDACLFDETLSVNMDWKKRFDIISGIARGLMYLHHDSRLRIIHRDLKPSNILLDDDLNPKISDFGIARIVEGKQTESSTIRVVGT